MENIFFLTMLNIELSYDSAIPLLGIYQRQIKIYLDTNICTWIFRAVLFIAAKNKTKKMAVNDESINKKWYMPTMEYYLAIKNDVLMYVIIWMNFKTIMFSERSQ